MVTGKYTLTFHDIEPVILGEKQIAEVLQTA